MPTDGLTIRYYFWIVSDWAYLGGERLEALAARYGVAIDYRPIKLPAVYARTGGIELRARARQRQDYRIAELTRWRAHLGKALNLQPRHLPTDDEPSSRVVIAAKRLGLPVGALTNAIMTALWAEDRDIADPATLRALGVAGGLDMDAVLAEAATPAVLAAYQGYTDQAPQDGVFGSPFYLFRGEPFWGQDRLDFLESAIVRAGGRVAQDTRA